MLALASPSVAFSAPLAEPVAHAHTLPPFVVARDGDVVVASTGQSPGLPALSLARRSFLEWESMVLDYDAAAGGADRASDGTLRIVARGLSPASPDLRYGIETPEGFAWEYIFGAETPPCPSSSSVVVPCISVSLF